MGNGFYSSQKFLKSDCTTLTLLELDIESVQLCSVPNREHQSSFIYLPKRLSPRSLRFPRACSLVLLPRNLQ
jgi:hypothetical protein